MVLISALLVVSGLFVLNHSISISSTFLEGVGSELFGAGVFIFALYLFGKATKIIKS